MKFSSGGRAAPFCGLFAALVCLFFLPASRTGADVLVAERGPYVWRDPASGGRIQVLLRVTRDVPAFPSRYLWVYTVQNLSYNPRGGNGLSGLLIQTPELPERQYVAGSPAGWLNNDANASDLAIQFGGNRRVLEWEKPDGAGVLPGQQAAFAFTTGPRPLAPGSGNAHTWTSGPPGFLFGGFLDRPHSPPSSRTAVFIHGFAGAELVQVTPGGDVLVYPEEVLTRKARLRRGNLPRQGDPTVLQFLADGTPRRDTGSDDIVPLRLIPEAPEQEAMIAHLRGQGFRVFAFLYDWRRSVRASALKLEVFLDRLIEQLEMENPPRPGDPPIRVSLVAHSMGGLVAKQYLQDHANDHPVETFITIGTPHLGAPKSLKVLRYGEEVTKKALFGLEVVAVDGCLVRRALHNMPGAYNLLPGRQYFSTAPGTGYFSETRGVDLNGDGQATLIDDFEETVQILKTAPEVIPRRGGCPLVEGTDPEPLTTLSAELLDRECVQLHDELDAWQKPPGLRVFAIAGDNKPTVQVVFERTRGKSAVQESPAGDGTVPLRSAVELDADMVYRADMARLKSDHLAMLANPQIQRQVDGLLRVGEGLYGQHISRFARPLAAGTERRRRVPPPRLALFRPY